MKASKTITDVDGWTQVGQAQGIIQEEVKTSEVKINNTKS